MLCPVSNKICDNSDCVGGSVDFGATAAWCKKQQRANGGTCTKDVKCTLAEGHLEDCRHIPISVWCPATKNECNEPCKGSVCLKYTRDTDTSASPKPLDPIHPTYYHGTEVDEFIERFRLGFRLGNAVKYIARYREKETPLQDLKKALWYLQREITRMEEIEALENDAIIQAAKQL